MKRSGRPGTLMKIEISLAPFLISIDLRLRLGAVADGRLQRWMSLRVRSRCQMRRGQVATRSGFKLRQLRNNADIADLPIKRCHQAVGAFVDGSPDRDPGLLRGASSQPN